MDGITDSRDMIWSTRWAIVKGRGAAVWVAKSQM